MKEHLTEVHYSFTPFRKTGQTSKRTGLHITILVLSDLTFERRTENKPGCIYLSQNKLLVYANYKLFTTAKEDFLLICRKQESRTDKLL